MASKIERDYRDMEHFSTNAVQVAKDLDGNRKQMADLIENARPHMQSASGRRALKSLETFVGETKPLIENIRTLAEQISMSAALLRESDQLL